MTPERGPAMGGHKVQETAGAIAVSARPFLIAFNVNLRSNEIGIARQIEREVRERDGGLPCVKALVFALYTRGLVQVSMNLTDIGRTSIGRAFLTLRAAAALRS